MLNINILKNGSENNIKAPAKSGDVGYDLVAKSITIKGESFNDGPVELVIKDLKEDLEVRVWKSVDYIEYDTGVQYELEYEKMIDEWRPKATDYYGQLVPRSSNSKYNLILANSVGTVDLSYRGPIKLRYKYHFQPEDHIMQFPEGVMHSYINYNKIYNIGDRCGQIVFRKFTTPNIKFVDNLSNTDRSAGGFGSTGK